MPTQVAVIKKNYIGQARIFQFLTVVILIAAAVYCYLQYQKLTAAQDTLTKGQVLMTSMQTSVDQFAQSYKDIQTVANADTAKTANAIQAVFPVEQSYTALTRTLEAYANSINTSTSTFSADTLSFSQPIMDPKSEYAVLPFTMTISTSRDNFDKFLRYVETSGDLDEGVRLMDIKSIALSLPTADANTVGTTGPQTIDLSVSMDSYFQKPVTGAATANPS